ncbi:class F sortase [Pseudarthrobacter sp. NamB4]|uniref:class F sortase n=1 Tax=Pseudarthrobacter sp. NamB4 TaxID=2576837 RepID=UPI001F10287C|nr:class F sortase [Pseudarthrobacter sp. NamB4]
MPAEKGRGTPRVAIGAVVAVLFLALTVFGIMLSGPGASPTLTAPSTPASQSSAAGTVTAALPPVSSPRQLSIESAKIKVPVLPLTPTESDLATQSLVPPETLDGYWLTNYGTPGAESDNTVYITGHSWENRDSPFNRLSSDVEVGNTVTLTTDQGTIDYVVDTVTTHNKDSLKDSDIWNIVPNRLVLISCYTEDLWGKNVIVTALPAVR